MGCVTCVVEDDEFASANGVAQTVSEAHELCISFADDDQRWQLEIGQPIPQG
jgi:hypothetical protein